MFAIQESHQLPDTMLTLSRVGDAAIVSLTCPAIHDQQTGVLERFLRDLAPGVGGRIVLEVASVGRFNCSWINALIALSRDCTRMGGRLVILGMPTRDERLLRSTGIDRFLDLASDRREALARFDAGSAAPWRLGVERLLDMPQGKAA
ncbi:MAG: STAS domain-containing protein [Planctomycetota bacterium]|nr:STAS domain-containing protein [Planctomycetota bacterium]